MISGQRIVAPVPAPKRTAGADAITYDGITTQWMLVTPAMAEEWLAVRNIRNRHHMPVLSGKYAIDMKAGDWIVTHQGIAFASTGVLVDGQHRLKAIVDSGESQVMLVTQGLAPAVIEAIDRGKVRTQAHTLQIMGFALHSAKAVALARFMFTGPFLVSSCLRGITDIVLRKFMEAHLEPLTFALALPGNLSTPVRAVFARAYYHVPPESIRRFVDALWDNISFDDRLPQDINARHVNRLMEANRGRAGEAGRVQIYRKTQNALRFYLHGQPIERLYATEQDIYPLPKTPDEQNAQPSLREDHVP